MIWLNKATNSIHRRAWSYIMITCVVVLGISIILNFAKAVYSFRAVEETFHRSIALTVEQNISASLTFNHQESVQELANGLVSNKYLSYVLILDKDKAVFAKSGDQVEDVSQIIEHVRQDKLETVVKVNSHRILITSLRDLDNNLQGYLLLVSNERLFQELLSSELFMVFWQLLFALVIASFLSRRFAHTLTRPILETSHFIHQIITHKDYSLQLPLSGQDEIGQLQQRLNELVQLAQNWTQELQDYGKNLAGKVEKRTKSLHQAKLSLELTVSQLKQAKDAADAANVAKTQFLANMSHEIRTPMQGILGMAELLAKSPLSYEQNQHLKTIRDSAESLLQIINDVLDFSKIEHGHLELHLAPVVLRTELEAIMRLFSNRAQKKGIELLCVMPIAPQEVFMLDKLRLTQVMVNLLGNAIKFTNWGKVTLKWKITQLGQDARVEISVIDTGIGIKPEKHLRIFESFQQEDTTTTREFGGTGLGLAISRQIVTKMGGQIGVTSIVGQGAQFTVTLDLPIVFGQSPRYIEPQQFSGLTIALCMPSTLQSACWQRNCEHWGVSCLVFATAKQFIVNLATSNDCQSLRCIVIDESFSANDIELVFSSINKMTDAASVSLIILGKNEQARTQQKVFSLAKPVSTDSIYTTLSELFNHQTLSQKESNQQQGFEYLKRGDVNVLVAEDNLTNQDFVRAVLNALGCKFDIVDNGVKANQMFNKNDYDLILMDCQMPEMDGYSATLSIRQIEQKNNQLAVPVIALTAHALGEEKQKCLAYKMNDYLSKPYNITSLVEMMNRHLPEHKQFEYCNTPDSLVPTLLISEKVEHKPVIEICRLDNIRALQRPNQENLLAKIITRFVGDSGQMLADLALNRRNGNIVELKLIAHKLKSSSRNLGGSQLGLICERLERAPAKALALIDDLLCQIENNHKAFIDDLLILKEQELEAQCDVN
jgi:two-component system sensor histidine kinase/response regulator